MANTTHEGFTAAAPDYVRPPGTTLLEELHARGMTQRALAQAMGRDAKIVSDIVRGKKAITPETALQLEDALDIPAYLWVRMEADYRLHHARQAHSAAMSA